MRQEIRMENHASNKMTQSTVCALPYTHFVVIFHRFLACLSIKKWILWMSGKGKWWRREMRRPRECWLA